MKKIQFKGQPVLGVHANRRAMVVVLRKRIAVMDATSLDMRFYVKSEWGSTFHGDVIHYDVISTTVVVYNYVCGTLASTAAFAF